jgi:hypothetical protein
LANCGIELDANCRHSKIGLNQALAEPLGGTLKVCERVLVGSGLPRMLRWMALLAATVSSWVPAWAGDLPGVTHRDGMRACPTFGTGFFYIPGSDTCVRLGGRVRAELLINPTWSRLQDGVGSRVRGRIEAETRNATDYGTLRAYVRVDSTVSTGAYSRSIPSIDTTGSYYKSDTALARALIQFVGFTAGRYSSFFDFYAGALSWGGTKLGSSQGSINGAAYTYTFSKGLSATLAFEDGDERAVEDGNYIAAARPMPDVVANLRLDQDWGSAQLSIAGHQIRPAYNDAFISGHATYGWAVQGGLKFELPALATGDQLWLQASYANGALNYLGLKEKSFRIGGLRYTLSDVVFADNSMQLMAGYSLTAAFAHYWVPTVRHSLFGNYTAVIPTSAAIASSSSISKAGLIQLGTNLTWSPLKDLDIGGEIIWFQLAGSNTVSSAVPGQAPLSRDSGLQYRMRLQRDF